LQILELLARRLTIEDVEIPLYAEVEGTSSLSFSFILSIIVKKGRNC